MSYHAVLVGVNNYPGTDSDLAGCVNDVRDWQRMLSKTSPWFPGPLDKLPFFHCFDSVQSLTDGDATLSRVKSAVSKCLAKLQPDDLAFFWFSSHGTYGPDTSGDEPDKTDEKLVLGNFDLWSDDAIYQTLISRPTGSRVFMGTDACHSGTVHRALWIPKRHRVTHRARFLHPSLLPSGNQITVKERSKPKAKTQAALPGVIHFAGCQDIEYCYDAQFNKKPNGAFTYYAINSLSRLKSGATFGDWFNQISVYLPSVEYNQQPRCNAKPDALRWCLPVRT